VYILIFCRVRGLAYCAAAPLLLSTELFSKLSSHQEKDKQIFALFSSLIFFVTFQERQAIVLFPKGLSPDLALAFDDLWS
jgi:hypothetical protein